MTLQYQHRIPNHKSTIFTKFGMPDELGVFRKRDNMILVDMENFIKELLLLGADPEEMERGRDSLRDEVPDADLWRRWIGKFLEC